MGNTACCRGDDKDLANTATAAELNQAEAKPILGDESWKGARKGSGAGGAKPGTYHVTLKKTDGSKLGLDVDYMEGRVILPIMAITGGLAGEWNTAHPDNQLQKGDSVVEVNGTRANVVAMLEKCKNDKVLEMTLRRALTYDHLVEELEKLITTSGQGALFVKLSMQDSGSYSEGRLKGGRANACLRFTEKGEGTFPLNEGLSEAIRLLGDVTAKYVPELISHADLWALAANVAIRMMGGPDILTRFGRIDATSAAESVEGQEGRLLDPSKGSSQIKELFHAKGFDDKSIVCLFGVHTVGKFHSKGGKQEPWTSDPTKFNNSYYKELATKKYNPESGCPFSRDAASGTIMTQADLTLLEPSFRAFLDRYAEKQDVFFSDFTEAWLRYQELGYHSLRDIL